MKTKGSVIAALDIGSSKIACFIAQITDDSGRFRILGVGHQAAKGIKSGVVTDLSQAEIAIRQTVHAAENMAADAMRAYPLREVILNVPGSFTTSQGMSVDIDIAGQDVTESDIGRALARAQNQNEKDAHELVHTIPVTYAIDGKSGIRDPRGMVGERLEVDIHMVSAQSAPLQNLAYGVERCHLDVGALCLSSYASGLSCLVEDEMDLGCTVIDIGAGITSFAVFYGGAMIYADAIPLGGQNVTSDIARLLVTSHSDAERLKVLYGSATVGGSDENEMIDVPQIGDDGDIHLNHTPRAVLIGIIQPRMEEILEFVRGKLQDSGVAEAAGRRVILTGGGSQLPGLRDLAQAILDKQVRLGQPIGFDGLPESVRGASFATATGLLIYMSERGDEMPAEIMAQAAPDTLWGRVQYWLRENW